MGRRGAPAFVFRLSAQSPQIGRGGGEVLIWGLGFGCTGEGQHRGSSREVTGPCSVWGHTPEKVWFSEWQDLSISTPAPKCSQGPLLACPPRPLSVSSPSRPFLGESGGVQLRKLPSLTPAAGSLLQFPLWSSFLLWRQLDTLGRAGGEDSWC